MLGGFESVSGACRLLHFVCLHTVWANPAAICDTLQLTHGDRPRCEREPHISEARVGKTQLVGQGAGVGLWGRHWPRGTRPAGAPVWACGPGGAERAPARGVQGSTGRLRGTGGHAILLYVAGTVLSWYWPVPCCAVTRVSTSHSGHSDCSCACGTFFAGIFTS